MRRFVKKKLYNFTWNSYRVTADCNETYKNTDQPMAIEDFSTEFYGHQLSGLVHENATEQIRPYNW